MESYSGKFYDEANALRVWMVLYKASQAIGQNARRSISNLKLGLSDFGVLDVLRHRGPQPVNAIGKRILLASASITAAINRLEKKGLVQRVADSKDLRARLVKLTPGGRKLIDKAMAQHAADMEAVMAVLRTGERLELVRLLKKVGLWAAAQAENSA